ncbi:DUF4145 domain-containing protein [Caulobacter segnis]|uniref:DUF4145 domain-containing protein n=1 Tax=Caulobacter segnis TaxID=88688 RepID=UPI00285527B6|nr:DUF4145 domain-containing protein [Caulobacter segnis]MDR6625706.1 hypothetical protein [Caulobacter segnis]
MGTLLHDCPHCGTAKMSFVVFGVRPRTYPNGYNVSLGAINVGIECQACQKPASASLRLDETVAFSDWQGRVAAIVKDHGAYPNDKWSLTGFWPVKAPVVAPEHLPAPVEKAFLQGEKNLALEGCEEPAATMFRRALDVGLKLRFPDLKGDLYKKIEKLAEAHAIPQSLADWAHEVRVIGNDGAHDLDGCSVEDAVAARNFVDAVLRYLFSLPGMIDSRRPQPAGELPEEES